MESMEEHQKKIFRWTAGRIPEETEKDSGEQKIKNTLEERSMKLQ